MSPIERANMLFENGLPVICSYAVQRNSKAHLPYSPNYQLRMGGTIREKRFDSTRLSCQQTLLACNVRLKSRNLKDLFSTTSWVMSRDAKCCLNNKSISQTHMSYLSSQQSGNTRTSSMFLNMLTIPDDCSRATNVVSHRAVTILIKYE